MNYEKETCQKWGDMEAYKESVKKTANYTKADWDNINQKASLINNKLAHFMDKPVTDDEVQQLLSDWQNHITKYYYNCTPELLGGLGKMYIADKRFKNNYDDIRPGLTQFISNAIKHYCDVNK